MKKSMKFIVPIGIVIFLGIIYFVFDIQNEKAVPKDLGTATAFSYNYGSYFGGYWDYSIYQKEDLLFFTAIGSNGVELDIDVAVDKSVLEDLTQILLDYNVWSWNGFDQQDLNVLDGYSFILNVKFKKDDLLAHGYMKYPKNYDEVHQVLEEYFQSLVEKYQAVE